MKKDEGTRCQVAVKQSIGSRCPLATEESAAEAAKAEAIAAEKAAEEEAAKAAKAAATEKTREEHAKFMKEMVRLSNAMLFNPVPKPRPAKRAACTSAKGGDNKRSRVALKSLQVVSNTKTGGRACEDSSNVKIKVPADENYSAATVRPERTYSETMEYFELLCQRVDLMEPTDTQDSGPNVRNPKIPSAWHTQLVEWMLHFPRYVDVQNSTIAVAVVFMQKFLTVQQVSTEWLQLLAMVCTFVASKVNENRGRKSITLRFLTQFVASGRYTAIHIKRFERGLLQSLQWNLHPVTSHALAMVMLELHPNKAERAKIMHKANILLDMQLPHKQFLQYSTKAIALGCFSAACTIAGCTEAHKTLLEQIPHLVDHKAVAEGEKVNVTLKRMYYVNFPEEEPEEKLPQEKRSSSPASIMESIAVDS